jgi:hypothetical protein
MDATPNACLAFLHCRREETSDVTTQSRLQLNSASHCKRAAGQLANFKVLAMTLGETGEDWVSMSLNLGYLIGSAQDRCGDALAESSYDALLGADQAKSVQAATWRSYADHACDKRVFRCLITAA